VLYRDSIATAGATAMRRRVLASTTPSRDHATHRGQHARLLVQPQHADQHCDRRREIDEAGHLRSRRTPQRRVPRQIADEGRRDAHSRNATSRAVNEANAQAIDA